MSRYVNPRTQRTWPVETPLWAAPDDGGYLNLTEGKGISANEIDTKENSLWRYRAALRGIDANVKSLGEGFTPLVDAAFGGKNIKLKLDYLMPSGSFKDRGTAVMLNYLKTRGVESILEDSSGNAGASIASYAAYLRLRCRILVPASAPQGKKVQIKAAGADMIEIAGTREDVTDAALAMAKEIFYASHNYQAFFLEGTKTLAFELWEQLGFEIPDAVVVPLGQGSNVMGLHIGFRELLAAKQIKQLPRIYGVQAANCAPYFTTYQTGGETFTPIVPQATVADGIANAKPVRLRENLTAMRETNGACLAVAEQEIIAAHKELCQSGFYVEPTSAAALAGFNQLSQQGKIKNNETAVLILTGHGLKATDRIQSLLPQ